VKFREKRYVDFDKNPKIRSQWGEDLVQYFFESKGYNTYKTDDIAQNRVKLERMLMLLVDDLFKNRDFHSIDILCIIETPKQRLERKRDEIFVRDLMNRQVPYDLGRFNRQRGYGLFIEYETNKGGQVKRRRIYLIPRVLFVEVKTFLKGCKPPVISDTELYKFIYLKQEMGIVIILGIIEIDTPSKKASINFIIPDKWGGFEKTWLKFHTRAKVTLLDLPEHARKPFPWKIPKGEKSYVPVLFLDKKGGETKVSGPTITYFCQIETEP
jgi:hypothetical protein